MNKKLIGFLSVCCASLIGLISVEWFYVAQAQTDSLKTHVPPVKDAPLDEMPALDLTQTALEDYGDFVNRPLFIKGRKPVDEPPPELKGNPSFTSNAITAPFDWQLLGIFSMPKKQGILVGKTMPKGKSKENYKRLKLDDELDGWKVTTIQSDKVVFTKGVETKELPLHKKRPKMPLNRQGMPPNQVPPNSTDAGPQPTPPEGTPPDQPPPVDDIPPPDPIPEPETNDVPTQSEEVENPNAHF